MNTYSFHTKNLFTYRWCGKFQSPSCDWVHMTRPLIDFELMIVTSGTLYIASDTTKYTVHQGEYLVMPPTPNQHGFQPSDCSFYWFHFIYPMDTDDYKVYDSTKDKPINSKTELAMSETGLPSSKTELLIPETGSILSLEHLLILMKEVSNSDKRYHDSNLNNYLASAVLAELANQSSLSQMYGDHNQQKQLYYDICDYILLHVTDAISLEELSIHFNYNKKYLTTFFRKQSGTTIKQFMLQAKIEHAKAGLRETNLPISELAYSLGFRDVHNFSNAFKKITGISPSDYRMN